MVFTDNYWQGVLYVSLISLLINILCGTANPSSDINAHYNWMKITRRLPIEEWYNYNSHFRLDYPAIQAYFHYFMSFIAAAIDPYSMDFLPLNYKTPINTNLKYTIRISILWLMVIIYYPSVIFCVTKILKKESNVVKLFTIALFFTMPIYAQIEHMNTQANSPTLGFLLWTIYFLLNGNNSLCAFFFALSILSKQITIPTVVPIGLSVLARFYHEGITI